MLRRLILTGGVAVVLVAASVVTYAGSVSPTTGGQASILETAGSAGNTTATNVLVDSTRLDSTFDIKQLTRTSSQNGAGNFMALAGGTTSGAGTTTGGTTTGKGTTSGRGTTSGGGTTTGKGTTTDKPTPTPTPGPGPGPGPNPIPEPATMVLLGTGVLGLAAKIRRRRQASDE